MLYVTKTFRCRARLAFTSIYVRARFVHTSAVHGPMYTSVSALTTVLYKRAFTSIYGIQYGLPVYAEFTCARELLAAHGQGRTHSMCVAHASD